MRKRDIDRKLFHKGHYEIIAGRFREQLEPCFDLETDQWSRIADDIARAAIADLAISLAKRLQLDNNDFDPIIFLDRCSPNPELYPLSGLWEGVNQAEAVDD